MNHEKLVKLLSTLPPSLVAIAGVVLGLSVGLSGFFYLETPPWALLWAALFALFALLGWLGFSAAPTFTEKNPVPAQPRRVCDGPLVMMELPGGSFPMGSPDTDDMAGDNEKPQHQVTLSGFRMATTPVTAGLYHKVMHDEMLPDAEARRPVVDIYWYDAIAFCNALSRQEGYRPCYRSLFGRWWCNWRADGYRLPTEAEWEYACRAGTKTRYGFGNNPAGLEAYAWFAENASSSQPVATKRPNRWGLYDMHGNVWEWCWDVYGSYPAQPLKNPRGPKRLLPAGSESRVLRGGSFFDSPEDLRSARRVGGRPEGWGRRRAVGFRCVRVPPQLID